MKGIFTILNYYFSPGRRAAQWPLATAPAAVGDRNLQSGKVGIKKSVEKYLNELPTELKNEFIIRGGGLPSSVISSCRFVKHMLQRG